jgi:hypothetical protein
MQITYIGTIQSHGLSGRGDAGWQNLARTIKDCHTILVSGAGDTPKKILGTMGFTIHGDYYERTAGSHAPAVSAYY